MMLIINTSALHTTTGVLTTALYELAERPELGEMLREEFLQHVGNSDGYDNAVAITTDLPMLDSFLKEVMRMTPPGYGKFPPLLSPLLAVLLTASTQPLPSARYSRTLRFPAASTSRPA